MLAAVVGGFVVALVLLLGGQVLLRHPAVGMVMRVLVARAVAEGCGARVVGVAEMCGHLAHLALAHVGTRVPDGERRPVALRCGGQVDRRLAEVELGLGQAHVFERVAGGHRDHQRRRVGQADVLAGEDDHPAGDEPGVLAGLEHPRQVVDGGLRVAAAHRLDERADDVVVLVAVAVVAHRGPVQGLLDDLGGDRAVPGGLGGHLQRRQRTAGVPGGVALTLPRSTDRQALIIDERFNSGGKGADYMIDYLRRPIWNYWTTRDGEINQSPALNITGPKVMIINEWAGSGGDALPWYFRRAKLGTLVGKRTWGGLVGIYDYPLLMDGGYISAPRVAFYNLQGEWDVENYGTPADIEVDLDPALWRKGRDPQLEKAVEVALAELKAKPLPKYKKPPYPNYNNGNGPVAGSEAGSKAAGKPAKGN